VGGGGTRGGRRERGRRLYNRWIPALEKGGASTREGASIKNANKKEKELDRDPQTSTSDEIQTKTRHLYNWAALERGSAGESLPNLGKEGLVVVGFTSVGSVFVLIASRKHLLGGFMGGEKGPGKK